MEPIRVLPVLRNLIKSISKTKRCTNKNPWSISVALERSKTLITITKIHNYTTVSKANITLLIYATIRFTQQCVHANCCLHREWCRFGFFNITNKHIYLFQVNEWSPFPSSSSSTFSHRPPYSLLIRERIKYNYLIIIKSSHK